MRFSVAKFWNIVVNLSCRQEVLLLDNEIAFNEAIIEEREQGIQEIQNQIGEVNDIFKDLAVLVHEQGTMIGKLWSFLRIFDFLVLWSGWLMNFNQSIMTDDISSHVDNAQAATSQGKTLLAKAAKTQRSNSSLVIHDSNLALPIRL